MDYLGKVLNNFLTYDLLRTLFIEVFKACITLLFAYISFRFFQNYKEKNRNNKVYIKILKLDADIRANIEKIQDILSLYKEGEELHYNLKVQGSDEKYYYNISEKINEIINLYYVDESYVDFYQQLVEVYYFERYPIECIVEVANEIENIKETRYDEGKLEMMENELNCYEQKDIFIDLEELYELISKADKEKKLDKFNLELYEFNNKDIDVKSKELNKFCKEMFFKNDIITEMREKYKRYNFLVRKLLKNDKKENIILNFNRFSDNDGILSEYNAEFYFNIEEVLDKYNNKVILLNDKSMLENTCKELTEYKYKIGIEIKTIKNKIDSTKRFFGK